MEIINRPGLHKSTHIFPESVKPSNDGLIGLLHPEPVGVHPTLCPGLFRFFLFQDRAQTCFRFIFMEGLDPWCVSALEEHQQQQQMPDGF